MDLRMPEFDGSEHHRTGRTTGRRPRFGAGFASVLSAAQADAPWAYQRLFEWLGAPVAGYLRGQGAEDADGLANEVFLRVFKALSGFEGDEDRFRSWVFTIAHHCLVDQRRREGRRPPMADASLGDRPSSMSTEAEAMTRLGAERVRALIDRLSADQRDVLLLRVVADLTVEQVASVMGRSTGAVKQLQRRGLATLRRSMVVQPRAASGSDVPFPAAPAFTFGDD